MGLEYFSQEEKDLLLGLSTATAVIGAISACLVVLMFSCYPSLREFKHRLILYLALNDAGGAILTFPQPSEEDGLCYFQGVSITVFDFQTVCWIGIIAWVLYQVIVKDRLTVGGLELWSIIGVTVLSLIFGLLPLSTGSIGLSANEYCWISEQTEKGGAIAWQVICSYGPLWVGFGIATYFYIKVYNRVKLVYEAVPGAHRTEQLKYLYRLRFFAFTLVVGRFFGTVNRVYLWFEPEEPIFALTALHITFNNMMGFYNFCVYWLHKPVRVLLCNSFQRLVCCERNSRKEEVELRNQT